MSIGLIGLLGILQIAVPQDTSLHNSIRELMDSVGPAVDSQETSIPLYLFRVQNQTEGDIFDCKVLYRGKEERTSVAVGFCERSSESGEKRMAVIVSARHDSAGVSQETIIIDSGRPYHADICYQNSIDVRNRKINIKFLNLEEDCQSLYYEFLKRFDEYRLEQHPPIKIT